MSSETAQVPSTRSRRSRRRYWFVLLSLLVGVVVADGSRCTPADPTKPIQIVGDTPLGAPADVLRVATFNIHSGRGRDREQILTRTATVFPSAPDIAGLNEVRGSFSDALGLDQARQLGEMLEMRSAFAATERRWWHDHFGNALLTRIPIRQIHRLPLPGTRGKAFRNAILVQFEFQNQTVQLLAVHVDSQSDREAQLQAVLALFQGLKAPAILMGDLNSTPDDPQLKRLLAQPDVVDALADASPKGTGRQHIDWILARGFRCRSGELIENEASDHPLVIAELELEEKHP